MTEHTNDYLLNKKVKLFQSNGEYKTSSDAVLVSSLLYQIQDKAKILDVGSGTGGISLCLAYRFPKTEIIGFEIQEKLVSLANKSANANKFQNLQYICHDINQKKAPFPFNSFNHVITNPPYEKNGSVSPNKSKALAHNQREINLQDWLNFCLKMLKPYGFLYLIHRAEALDEILAFLHKKAGNIKIIPVYSKEGEKAKRILLIAQKASKTPLCILKPLVIHQQKGHTAEAVQILRNGKSFFEIDNLKS